MNKSELKKKWGKYCDTDKLVDDVRAMYSKNRHGCTVHGVCVMLDEFFTKKEPNIQLIVNSKNYIGNLRIAVQKEFDRTISSSEIRNFFHYNRSKFDAEKLLEYKDADGKEFYDYLYTGKKVYTIEALPGSKEQADRRKILNRFERNTRATIESYNKMSNFNWFLDEFYYINASKLPRDINMGENYDAPVLKAGTKTSRAFNTMCCYFGVDKFNPQTITSTDAEGNVTTKTVYPYNKIFAEYSDLVSDLARKMYFVISLNPLDYLTMSNGVSWKSCHNIYDGCYKGGTLSYMLDSTSFVTFVVNDLKDPLHESLKFYRQMFHYDNGMFMQNRLYPQGNDGATNLYDKFRNFMIEEFSELIGAGNEWTVEMGREACKRHTNNLGVHYKDYLSNHSCNVFYPVASTKKLENHVMTVGHNGICAKCGKPFSMNGKLSHDNYDLDCKAE